MTDNNLVLHNITHIKDEHLIKGNKLIYKYYIFPKVVIYEVLIGIFSLFMIYMRQYILGIIFIFILLFFPILISFYQSKQVSKMINKLNDSKISYDYSFYDSSLKIIILVNGITKEYNYDYNKILRVAIEEDYIFIFINNSSFFSISKQGFDEYKEQEFLSFIKEKVKKYEVLE